MSGIKVKLYTKVENYQTTTLSFKWHTKIYNSKPGNTKFSLYCTTERILKKGHLAVTRVSCVQVS